MERKNQLHLFFSVAEACLLRDFKLNGEPASKKFLGCSVDDVF